MNFKYKKKLETLDEYIECEFQMSALWEQGSTPELEHLVDLLVRYEEDNENSIREVYGDDSSFSWDDTFEWEQAPYPFDP